VTLLAVVLAATLAQERPSLCDGGIPGGGGMLVTIPTGSRSSTGEANYHGTNCKE